MTFKLIITGSSGLLGRSVYKRLCNETKFDVHGLVFSRISHPKAIKCDLTDEAAVKEILDSIKPNLIIHCAAERRPDVVSQDPQKAKLLNVDSTKLISLWAHENNSRVVYISTDYVFDGSKPPYSEEDAPNPLNEYGLMKLKSERHVLDADKMNIVLRVPILYGDVEFLDESAVTTLFKKVQDSSSPALMSNYEKRFPTHCDDVAETIVNIVKYWSNNHENFGGIFHYQAEEEMTKLDMAMKMAEVFSLSFNHIIPEKIPNGTEATKRPYKSELKCQKLKALGLYHHPRPFHIGIMTTLKRFDLNNANFNFAM